MIDHPQDVAAEIAQETPPGRPFAIKVTIPSDQQANLKKLYYTIGHEPSATPIKSSITGPEKVTDVGQVFEILALAPKLDTGQRADGAFPWSPGATEVDVTVGVLGGREWKETLNLSVTSSSWGTVWGVAMVLGLFLVVYLMKPQFEPETGFDDKQDKRKSNWTAKPAWVRALLTPLRFCVTPIDTYSISLAQVLFWTAVVMFSATYVASVRGGFLVLTQQYLGLLGIAGGTAIAAKANAVLRSRAIPAKYLAPIKRERTPCLRDLIATDGKPNIFKFQMLAFTLINGVIVLDRVYTHFGLPEIPAEQLTLMGVSSGVYLGNEMVSDNIWEKIKAAEAIDPVARPAEHDAAKKEVTDLLQQVYS